MKYKEIFLASTLVIIIAMAGCGNLDNGNEVEKEHNEDTIIDVAVNYDVLSETYIQEDEYNNIKIEYPVITGLIDEDMQKSINKIIMAEALKVYNYYDYEDRGHLELDVISNITLENESVLSIQYYGLGYVENAAHPNKLFYTTNIDLLTGVKMKLADYINIEDDFVNMFIGGEFKYVGPLGEEPDLGYYGTYDMAKEGLINADNMGSIFSYLTNDSIGISIPVAHAIGGYALFEIGYDDIRKYSKYSDGGFDGKNKYLF